MLYKINIILITFLFIFAFSEKTKNYGEFNLTVTKLESCKGPKKKDCGIFAMQVVGKATIRFDYNITESMSPTKGKVLTVSDGKDGLRLQINKPCENLFLRPLLQAIFNTTNNCMIRKGRYQFNLDFEEQLRRYYGGMHLFGARAFKFTFYNDYCNLSWGTIETSISGKS